MIAFLIPFAVIVGALMLSGRRTDARVVSGSQVQFVRPGLVDPNTRGVARVAPPTPLATLCDYLRSGRRPPEFVVRCAVAEAELLGRRDLAFDLVQTFGVNTQRVIDVPAASEGNGGAQERPAQPAPQASPQATQPAPALQFNMTADDPNAQGVPAQSLPSLAATLAATLASPLPGVPDVAWADFCARLERESPAYDSQRHVGRYRQNKARLVELGIDPTTLVNAPTAQDAALAADMVDACKHVIESGLGNAVVGKPISIPDVAETPPISLSGILGVASVAGLEGCVEWLGKKHDRKKFPHTTQAFLRCNGVF